MNVFKIRESAKLPTRAHPNDAGMDLYFAPANNEPAVLSPQQSAILQTGLKIEVPRRFMLQIMNKSGIAAKQSLLVGACVVDHGYDGEVFVNLQNVGLEERTIHPGQKLAQGVFVEVYSPLLVEIGDDNIYGRETSRGAASLGSSGDY